MRDLDTIRNLRKLLKEESKSLKTPTWKRPYLERLLPHLKSVEAGLENIANIERVMLETKEAQRVRSRRA